MNPDTESQLREAFNARAIQVSERDLDQEWAPDLAAPIPTRPSYRGFLIAGLAAAAVIAVVVGTTVGLRLSSERAHPAVPVSSTSPAPTPSESVSGSSPSPTSTATSTNPAATQPAASQPAAPTQALALKFGTYATVSVTVPQTWGLSKSQPTHCCSTSPTLCITYAGTDYAKDPQNCRLAVTVSTGAGLDPNFPWPTSDQPVCKTWTTTQNADATISGRPAEYRQFRNGCTGAISEQWTIVTSPAVVFWHPISTASSSTLVTPIVMSAVLPPVADTHRLMDIGIVRNYHPTLNGGCVVTIDRVVESLDGSIINVNPATYDYPLSADAQNNCGDLVTGQLIMVYNFGNGVYAENPETNSRFHPGP